MIRRDRPGHPVGVAHNIQRKQFSFADVNRHLDFDCNRYIRKRGRLGFLTTVQDAEQKRVAAFIRSSAWPPPAKLFQQGAVGVAYYLQKWFRFKLQDWINVRMHELESKEGVYSLEGLDQIRPERITEGAAQENKLSWQALEANRGL